ncbi:ferredoxin [uncultured Tateyamaria sp.]|uniref:ferredoxin n=1 Tax=uncultured Tateyamaria sp. TaxID=455651 RepID=UPI00262B209A|nr:ferredoxin [uncultured Tateyamaria sp.]
MLRTIADEVRAHGMFVMGHDEGRVLIGADATFWAAFTAASEYHDGIADPIDRYSKRVIKPLAARLKAQAEFPSDGPPYAPFIRWALDTGRFWQSPTGMMVHDTAGLMISIRGALIFDTTLTPSPAQPSPCETCTDRPCIDACPVNALSDTHPYDVPSCKAYLDTPPGEGCMTFGCHVRRACPISQTFDRADAQSAFHMQAFRD